MDLNERLTALIREMPEYSRCQTTQKALMRIPGLKASVDDFRRRLYELYAAEDSHDLLVRTKELREEYADLLSVPDAGAYLRAEAALAMRMRNLIEQGVRAAELKSPF